MTRLDAGPLTPEQWAEVAALYREELRWTLRELPNVATARNLTGRRYTWSQVADRYANRVALSCVYTGEVSAYALACYRAVYGRYEALMEREREQRRREREAGQ